MNRIITLLLAVALSLSTQALALTSSQRDTHFSEMLSGIGATVKSCQPPPQTGYGLVCANVSGSLNSLARLWDLYIDWTSKVTHTARHSSPWRSENNLLTATFATADGDTYIVVAGQSASSLNLLVGWIQPPIDGNLARVSRLSNPTASATASPATNTASNSSSQTTPAVTLSSLPGSSALPLIKTLEPLIGGDARWSPDGMTLYTLSSLLSGGKALVVRAWDPSNATLRRERRLPLARESYGQQLNIAPDGKLLYVLADYQGLTVLDAITLDTITTVALPNPGFVNDMAVNPVRSEVAVITGGTLYLVDLVRGSTRSGPSELSSASYSNDGSALVLGPDSRGGRLGPVQIVDALTLQPLRVLTVPGSSYVKVRFSPDGKRIAALSGTTLSVLTVDGVVQGTLELPRNRFLEVPTWSPDGSLLAVAMTDSSSGVRVDASVWLIDAATVRPMYTFGLSGVRFISVATFSPDGMQLATAELLFNAPLGIQKAVAEAVGTQSRATQQRDNQLARIQPLCDSGQLGLAACLRAKAAITDGRLAEFPDLRDFLEGKLTLEQFLARWK